MGRAAVLIGALVAAIGLIAPIQLGGALQNLTQIEGLPVNATAAFFSLEGYAALFLGAVPVFGLVPGTALGWAGLAGLILLVAAFALALAPGRRRDLERWRLVAIAGGVLVTTAAIVLRYGVNDDLPYQVYKGLIAGGAVLAGLVVVGLLPRRRTRAGALRLLALGLVGRDLDPGRQPEPPVVGRSGDGVPGRRRADGSRPRPAARGIGGARRGRRARRALVPVPNDGRLLRRGRPPPHRGRARHHGHLPGAGRPARLDPEPPVDARADDPVPSRWTGARQVVWSNGVYTLSAAPTPDVTTYGTHWYPPEQEDGVTFAWTSGPVQVVVSNRGAARAARLRMVVGSYARPRILTVMTGTATRRVRLPAWDLVTVDVPLRLPARSATAVCSSTPPPAPGRARPGILGS